MGIYRENVNKNIKSASLIIVHLPKTGGSTLVKTLHENNIKYIALHLDAKYDSAVYDQLDYLLNSSQKIIITMRDPFEQFISCFCFFQEYPHINPPREMVDYLDTTKFHNIQCKTFTNQNLFDNSPVININKIIKLLNKPNVFVFMIDKIEESLNKLNTFLGKKITTLSSKRVNTNKIPSLFFNEFKDRIIKCNKHDYLLYDDALVKFNYSNESSYDPPLPKICFKWPLVIYIEPTNSFFTEYKDPLIKIKEEIYTGSITRSKYIIKFIHLFLEVYPLDIHHDDPEIFLKIICETILKRKIELTVNVNQITI